jgi:hypothetical protein
MKAEKEWLFSVLKGHFQGQNFGFKEWDRKMPMDKRHRGITVLLSCSQNMGDTPEVKGYAAASSGSSQPGKTRTPG